MKKIMIIHHSGSIGGAGVSVYNTITSLSKKYETVIYCPSYPNNFSSFLSSKGITVKTYDIPLGAIHYFSGGARVCSIPFFKNLLNILKHKSNWEKLIKDENPDLVIVNSKILSWFSLLTKKLGIKSICHVRETRKKSLLNLWNNIQSKLLDEFSGVIFISKYDESTESLKKAVTTVVPNFLELSMYEQKNSREYLCEKFKIPPSGFNILFVGGMLRIKGYDVAVKSMKYLKNYNINLIVAGDPKFHYRNNSSILNRLYNFLKKIYENNINGEIDKHKLNRKIYKVGIQNEMADIYTLADVLIFPASEPHQARPAFEAGVQKIPVIMPDFNNTHEYVKDHVNGLIFKRRDPKSLAKQIKKLIDTPELRKSLGEENRKFTKKNHVKEYSEDILLEMINKII